MEIFNGPPSKRRRVEVPQATTSSSLGSAYQLMTHLEPLELFPHSPRRIQPDIEVIDLSSDDEELPLDLTVRQALSRSTVIQYAPPAPIHAEPILENLSANIDDTTELADIELSSIDLDDIETVLLNAAYSQSLNNQPDQLIIIPTDPVTESVTDLADIESANDSVETATPEPTKDRPVSTQSAYNQPATPDPSDDQPIILLRQLDKQSASLVSFNDQPIILLNPLSDEPVNSPPVSPQSMNTQSINNQPNNNQPVSIQLPAKEKRSCARCGKSYVQIKSLERHQASCGLRMCTTTPADVPNTFDGYNLIKTAFARFYLVYRFKNTQKTDLISLFALIQLPTIQLLRKIVKQFLAIKYYFSIECVFHEEISGKSTKIHFTSSVFTGLLAEISSISLSILDELSERIDQFTQRGSGWTLASINHIDLMVGKFIPHKGGCTSHRLPERLANKKALISPATETDCFMYSVLIGLHPVESHKERIIHYSQYINEYDFSMVRGIVPITDIKKFERANDVSVNLYMYDFESEKVVPMKINHDEKDKHVNLFLHDDHYYYISNICRLANTVRTRSRYICHRCLSPFRLRDQLEVHIPDCIVHIPQRIEMPKGNRTVCKRWNYRKETQFPFCIYADFETLSVAQNDDDHILTDLVPCSYGYVVVDWTGKIIHQDFYLGTDVGKKFLMSLKSIEDFLAQYLEDRVFKDHNLSQSEEEDFRRSTHCHICNKWLGRDRARDHCHLTGNYRGAAHKQCNIEYRLPSQYPVVFHNLKNFDGHIIINALDSDFCESNPRLIAHNTEKFIGFFARKFKFMDSFAFLSSSLDNLSSNISTDKKNHFLRQIFNDTDTSLLLKKSALPYEYLTSLEVFDETSLPPKTAFHSSLTDSNISDEMYEHLQHVWSTFNCQSMKDLHDIYLKVDVLLLAAVFENFRQMSFDNFALDPLHQFSAPGLTWNAALKQTQIELGLLTDTNMLLMIEKGKRGGPTIVMNRHVKANNKYLPDYDPSKPTSNLLYLDVNNLYGYAMSEKLPVRDFKWSDVPIEQILNTPDDSDTGYILEIDLEYPRELHDLHNDFPLAPEKMEINADMYSEYQTELVNDLKEKGIKPIKSTKLVASLTKKERYVVHYRTLKFYVAHGLKVSKVHRIIEFYQSAWLADYVKFCTGKRQAATSDFERDFWKLLVNSIYGKTIEDKRKHQSISIALRDIQAQRQLRKNHCKKFIILDENKMLFWMKKLIVMMDKPIAVGFAILELAKLKMYSLHYDTFKAHYGSDINLVYTDTDSLIYNIKTEDIVDDLKSFSSIMDFSNYDKDHPLYSNANNKKIGYLKDELGGKQLAEFIGIRPKLYALKTIDEVKKRAKGVPRAVLKNKISFDNYLECLYDHQITREEAVSLQSVHHNIHMVRHSKVMLSPLDDKRYWLDRLSSLAYGHYRISN